MFWNNCLCFYEAYLTASSIVLNSSSLPSWSQSSWHCPYLTLHVHLNLSWQLSLLDLTFVLNLSWHCHFLTLLLPCNLSWHFLYFTLRVSSIRLYIVFTWLYMCPQFVLTLSLYLTSLYHQFVFILSLLDFTFVLNLSWHFFTWLYLCHQFVLTLSLLEFTFVLNSSWHCFFLTLHLSSICLDIVFIWLYICPQFVLTLFLFDCTFVLNSAWHCLYLTVHLSSIRLEIVCIWL